jgi:hypothetical protein
MRRNVWRSAGVATQTRIAASRAGKKMRRAAEKLFHRGRRDAPLRGG